MKVEKIDRVIIAVKNLEEAAKFFSDVLDVKFSKTLVGEEQQVKAKMSALGIELVESLTPNGPVARFINNRGEGVYAVIFKVSDLKDAITEMTSKGLRLIDTVKMGKLKEAIFHPKDSHGVMIVLCEYEETHGALIATEQT